MSFAALLACILATTAAGQLTPTTPAPGDIFKAGENCKIAWNADQSGIWNNVTISMCWAFGDVTRQLNIV
jgi:hypothetical protein